MSKNSGILIRRELSIMQNYCRQKVIDRYRWIKEEKQFNRKIREQRLLADSSILVREPYPVTMAALRQKVDDFCARSGHSIAHNLDAQFLSISEKTPEEMLAFRGVEGTI
jgi:hypothetical protein